MALDAYRPWTARSDDQQAEVGREGIEIAIVVQQAVPALDAEGRYDEVGGLANRNSPATQHPIVRRRLHGNRTVQHLRDPEHPKLSLDPHRIPVIARAL